MNSELYLVPFIIRTQSPRVWSCLPCYCARSELILTSQNQKTHHRVATMCILMTAPCHHVNNQESQQPAARLSNSDIRTLVSCVDRHRYAFVRKRCSPWCRAVSIHHWRHDLQVLEPCPKCSDISCELGLKRDGQRVMVTRYCWPGRADSDMGVLVERQESMQRVADLQLVGAKGGD